MSDVETPPPSLLPDTVDSETRFVAVRVGDFRRGLRLEEIYWRALKDIAASHGMSVGALVRSVEEAAPEDANLTSLLRVLCLNWFMDRLSSVQKVAHRSIANSLVQASPAPTFALGLDRQIVAYNPFFLNLIQSRLSMQSSGTVARNLRLALDVQIGELVETLRKNSNMPVGTGFVIGVENQRFRGRMNAVLAPAIEQAIVVCFVLPD
jgi:predicted DNA-binding ribbon-helix-helix protein